MNQSRKILGVVDNIITKKDGISFPWVRAWLRGLNDIEMRHLERLFPDRGTVFLHVSQCENEHPLKNQVGLFECVESPGEKAEWKVIRTSHHLAVVYDWSEFEGALDHLKFWNWLKKFRDEGAYNILLGERVAFVRWQKGELVGPFLIGPDGRLTERDRSFRYAGVDIPRVDVGGKICAFVDTDTLVGGKPIFLDPREAIQRRLKIVSYVTEFAWLSRNKVRELAEALAVANSADGSEWVTNYIPSALASLSESGEIPEETAKMVLKHKTIRDELETLWRQESQGTVAELEGRIKKLEKERVDLDESLSKTKLAAEKALAEKKSTEEALRSVESEYKEAKVRAQQAFDEELRRLAQSPASLALMGAWSGNTGRIGESARFLICERRLSPEKCSCNNLVEALTHNLRQCGLSLTCANEVSTVTLAALSAGQPLSLKSTFADIICEALALAISPRGAVFVDVPAGVLDPVDWSKLLPEFDGSVPLVLRGADRSDGNLVLGSLRATLGHQVNGHVRPSLVAFLTLESVPGSQVRTEFPVGPVIDDKSLRISSSRQSADMLSCSASLKMAPMINPITSEEFADIGKDLLVLPSFVNPVQQLPYRRAWAALKEVASNPVDVTRLLFKYWCLPRVPPESAISILENRQQLWKDDKFFEEAARASVENE